MRGQKDYNIQRIRKSATKECLLYMTEKVKCLSTPEVETQKMLEQQQQQKEWIGREKEYVLTRLFYFLRSS